MTILKLKCKKVVADYLRSRYPSPIKITATGVEMDFLRNAIKAGSHRRHELRFVEEYPDFVEIEFPQFYIWKAGKVAIPSTAVMAMDSFIRNLIKTAVNNSLDLVKNQVKVKESDMIFSYLITLGIKPENINLDTFLKARYRNKVKANNGNYLKKNRVKVYANL